MADRAKIGSWAQIERVILPAGRRAPQVPEDTQNTPLIMRVKGFAQQEGEIGEEITVRTVIGREVTGKLVALDPSHQHDFGRPVAELTEAGLQARELLAGAGDGGAVNEP